MVESDLPVPLAYAIACEGCGREDPPADCCGGHVPVAFRYSAPLVLPACPEGSIWNFRDQLPIADTRHAITLGEGGTPLLASRLHAPLSWKAELLNPTGSQKDRAIAVAISNAVEFGATRVVITSTGSAGIACAAYCARAGLPCVIVVPRGIPESRVGAMRRHGAGVVRVDGAFAAVGEALDHVTASARWYRAGTNRRVNRYQAEGTKTLAYEIVAQLAAVPDVIICGVGGGGTLAGLWRGLRDLRRAGLVDRLPRLLGAHPARVPRLGVIFTQGLATEPEGAQVDPNGEATTCMDNLTAGRRSDLADAVVALRESGGHPVAIEEDEARLAQCRLAREEGLFADLSACAAVAAAYRLVDEAAGPAGCRAVSIVTGAGHRDVLRGPVDGVVDLQGSASRALLEEAMERALCES